MARDWEATQTLADIQAKMATCGVNVAPTPLAMAMELRDRAVVWTVDLHVRVRGKAEFEISSEAASLSEALRRAHKGLAIEAAKRFGGDTCENEVLGFAY